MRRSIASNALERNEAQNDTFDRIISAVEDASMYTAVNAVPDQILASSHLNSAMSSRSLPNGHWRTEVEGCLQAVLSRVQLLQFVYVDVPLDVLHANDVVLTEPSTMAMEKQCTQQRIAVPQQYENYNLFALVLIAVFGLLMPDLTLTLKASITVGPDAIT